MSRVVSVTLAALLLVIVCCPRVLAYLVTAPAAVVSALLLYYAAFMIVGGLRLITRQTLNLRATFIVGVSVSLALGAPDALSEQAASLTDENIFALGLSRYLDITRPDSVDVRTRGHRVRLRFTYDLV